MLMKSTLFFIGIDQFLQLHHQPVRITDPGLPKTRLVGLLQTPLQILKVIPGKRIPGKHGQQLLHRVYQFLPVFSFVALFQRFLQQTKIFPAAIDTGQQTGDDVFRSA